MRRLSTVLAVVVAVAGVESAYGQAHFLRGDANHDKQVNIADGIYILNDLFSATGVPPLCQDAADLNDDGQINIADPVFVFNFLFGTGGAPAAPYPVFEADPTIDDEFGCLEVEEITGDITEDVTLTADKAYRLVSAVVVKDGATLNIEAGTTVLGDSASNGLLVIERGGKLNAIGTPTHPVVFTSDKPVGERGRGDWGGLIFLGRGDNNLPTKEGLAEGLENQFWGGGENVIPEDSSGKLSYVRVEFGGTEISEDNEVNAISIFGVGSGTEFDHVMVKYNLDDGFEWFGGAASLKYGLAVGIGDDSFDYSFGWSGNGQFWVAQQSGDDADRGFEVDNSESEFEARPLTRPILSNVTLIGDPDGDEGSESTDGITLRRGAGTVLYNATIAGFKKAGIDLDDGVTTSNFATDDLIVDYSVFQGNGEVFKSGETEGSEETTENGFDFTTEAFITEMMTNNIFAEESVVVDPYNLAAPNFRPQNDALTNPFDPSSLGTFFEPAPYRAGVAPDGDDWTQAPWISYAAN